MTTLEPYLGAFGHLVALRDGDLAYLHAHPEGAEAAPGEVSGPTVAFAVEAPTAGRYLLYLDFQVDGQVRTAAFTVEATGATSTPTTPRTTPRRATTPPRTTTTDHPAPGSALPGRKEHLMTASAARRRGRSSSSRSERMTCASCAMRIEKKLNKLKGVTATVNYATEKAKVTVPDGVDVATLVAEVEDRVHGAGPRAAAPPPRRTRTRTRTTPSSPRCGTG